MMRWLNFCCISVISFTFFYTSLIPQIKHKLFPPLRQNIVDWIEANDINHLLLLISVSGCQSLEEVAALELPDATEEEQMSFSIAKSSLKNELIFKFYLTKYGFSNWIPRFSSVGVNSLEEMSDVGKHFLEEQEDGNQELLEFFSNFPREKTSIKIISSDIWSEIAFLHGLPINHSWDFSKIAVSIICIGVIMWLGGIYMATLEPRIKFKGIFQFLTGNYLYSQWCCVEFLWTEPKTVGATVSFIVKFFHGNGKRYPVSDADCVVIEITQGLQKIGVLTELGGTTDADMNLARCKFTPRKAGHYKISVSLGEHHIPGSPFFKHFLPGPPDASKIALIQHCSTIVITANVPHFFMAEPRDSYQNICSLTKSNVDLNNYSIIINEIETGLVVDSSASKSYDYMTQRILIEICLPLPGCYSATISYCDAPLVNGRFEIITLTAEDYSKVQKTVLRRYHEGYEARLISHNEVNMTKPKKVYCYVTPKQLFIQEYILKFIPKRVYTFRLCPATKFHFGTINNFFALPTMKISDGCQPSIGIASKDRDVIAATFTQFMLKNIGGSETFKDKQDHFYHEVRRYHSKRPHERIAIAVPSRDDLLKSSMKATKYFTLADWCRNFEIQFLGEEGLDWGGIRREWFELICASLFDPSFGLFKSFHEGSQALVHPNSDRQKELKMKYYEFAGRIVGKCLYESALGTSYRLLVKARFTKSFLAQLIGLRVHYKHFAHDDPDFYSGKILHLLEHGVTHLVDHLYFTDEILLPNGQIKTVELKPGGSCCQVINENIHEYLDALAQFRLASQVKLEIEAFLNGINDIIPEHLLCNFDENELELLMCGIEVYSITDFKENHISCSNSPDFKRVLNWFWTAVSNFSEEEMAKLLQFTTGCSRLPAGGFQHLSPPFQIAPSHSFGNLPTAHTCFNQLCLPDYDSYEDFVKAVLLAIKEGSEGFGMI